MRFAFLFAIVSLGACNDGKESTGRSAAQEVRPPGKNLVDEEVKRALILDGAIQKLEAELKDLEAAPSPDAALIAQKKDALDALRSTLERTKRHIEMARGSGTQLEH